MKITQAQRDAYRYALEDKGVPEVIAFMAAMNYDGQYHWAGDDLAADLIYSAFLWLKSKEGPDFWEVIFYEAMETCK